MREQKFMFEREENAGAQGGVEGALPSAAGGRSPARQRPAGEGFITKDEVARLLRRSERTIEKWQRRGVIPFYRVGRSVFFKWSEIEARMEEKFRVAPAGGGVRGTARDGGAPGT